MLTMCQDAGALQIRSHLNEEATITVPVFLEGNQPGKSYNYSWSFMNIKDWKAQLL